LERGDVGALVWWCGSQLCSELVAGGAELDQVLADRGRVGLMGDGEVLGSTGAQRGGELFEW
jgi:hypothetical protein